MSAICFRTQQPPYLLCYILGTKKVSAEAWPQEWPAAGSALAGMLRPAFEWSIVYARAPGFPRRSGQNYKPKKSHITF